MARYVYVLGLVQPVHVRRADKDRLLERNGGDGDVGAADIRLSAVYYSLYGNVTASPTGEIRIGDNGVASVIALCYPMARLKRADQPSRVQTRSWPCQGNLLYRGLSGTYDRALRAGIRAKNPCSKRASPSGVGAGRARARE